MKAIAATFKQERALVGAFSVIYIFKLREGSFQALLLTLVTSYHIMSVLTRSDPRLAPAAATLMQQRPSSL